jgi:hypothetical protein
MLDKGIIEDGPRPLAVSLRRTHEGLTEKQVTPGCSSSILVQYGLPIRTFQYLSTRSGISGSRISGSENSI